MKYKTRVAHFVFSKAAHALPKINFPRFNARGLEGAYKYCPLAVTLILTLPWVNDNKGWGCERCDFFRASFKSP